MKNLYILISFMRFLAVSPTYGIYISSSLSMVNVTFITLTSLQYLQTLAGYEAGIEYVHQLYNGTIGITYVAIYHPEKVVFRSSCEIFADNVVDIAADYYYHRAVSIELNVFMGPWCTSELLAFAPVAQEWDVPVISGIGTDPKISDKKLYPTILTAAPANQNVLMIFLQQFLRRYNWTTVLVFCDEKRDVGFYRAACQNVQLNLKAPEFQINALRFDTTKGLMDFASYLRIFTKSARVGIILARSDVTRKFLIQAHQGGFCNGEYVYLHVQPFVDHLIWPDLSWYRNDSNNHIAQEAFRSVLGVIFDNDRSRDGIPDSVLRSIKRRAKDTYNITLLPDEKINSGTVTAFETVLMTAEVINETLWSAKPKESLFDGRQFTKKFWDRTFNLPNGPLYINKNGDRYPNILVRQLNWTTGQLQSIVLYTTSIEQFSLPWTNELVWVGANVPLNEPFCGFTGRKPRCSDRQTSTMLITTLVAVLMVSLGLLAGFSYLRCMFLQNHLKEQWWKVVANELDGEWMCDGRGDCVNEKS